MYADPAAAENAGAANGGSGEDDAVDAEFEEVKDEEKDKYSLTTESFMSKRDYYEVLDVDSGADAAALKKASRRVAMNNHPDRNPANPDEDNIYT